MIWAITLTLCVGISAAASTSDHCIPNQFTAHMTQVGANAPKNAAPQVLDNLSIIDYDYGAKMMRIQAQTMDVNTGMRNNATIIEDYNTGKAYTMYGGKCMVGTVNPVTMRPPCEAGNSTVVTSYMIGQINVVVRQELEGQMVRYYHTNMADHSPIAEVMYGTNSMGVDTIESMNFGNVMLGQLSEPNPFMIPDICNHGTPAVGKRSAIEEQLSNMRRPFVY